MEEKSEERKNNNINNYIIRNKKKTYSENTQTSRADGWNISGM